MDSHSKDAYQHWLDDAAQMGLMLYRMRNDSKRENMQPRSTPPPPPPPAVSGRPPVYRQVLRTTSHHPPPPPSPVVVPTQPPYAQSTPAHSRDTTPRTQRAIQTPTVATQHYVTQPDPVRPSALHLPLD